MVAKMTGLSVDTLRAWERRYGAVSPRRDDAGVRCYSENDVARLELLRAATVLGHQIGRVAVLANDELLTLVGANAQRVNDDHAPLVTHIIEAIRRYDVVRADELLASAAQLLKAEDLFTKVVCPLMGRVGEMWERGDLSIAQEHLVSTLVRNLLGTMMHPRVSTKANMLFATPPGEPHEFGILIAACLASMCGFRPCVLGTQVPAQEVSRAARFLRPKVIVIGRMMNVRTEELRAFLRVLHKRLPHETRVWIGGAANGQDEIEGGEYVELLTDFIALLRTL